MDREYKSSLRCLKIGDKVAELPIIQGGMGVGVSRSSLAGAVAAEGGVGVISTAQIGYDEAGFEKDQAGCNLKAIRKHIWKAREIAKGKGLVGVNIMVALKHCKGSCGMWCRCDHQWRRTSHESARAGTGVLQNKDCAYCFFKKGSKSDSENVGTSI